MELQQVLENRFSVREYSERPLVQSDLDQILQAGRIAPSARNSQPQRILVVQSAAGIEKIDRCTPCRFGAGTVLIVCADTTILDGRYQHIDPSICMTYMMLQATDLGVGSLWVGRFDPDAIRREFPMPAAYRPVSLMMLGYPASDAKPREMHFSRQPLEETVAYEAF